MTELTLRSPRREAALRRGAVVRDRIVDAGYRLFVERGYADVSIEQIADAAGVSRRTVYNKFADKEAIYHAAFEPAIDELEAATRMPGPVGDSAHEVLHRHASAMSALLEHPRLLSILRVLVLDRDAQPWLARAFVGRVRMRMREAFRREIEGLIARGKLPAHDAAMLVEQFFGTTLGIIAFPRLLNLKREKAAPGADTILRSTIDSLLDGWLAA